MCLFCEEKFLIHLASIVDKIVSIISILFYLKLIQVLQKKNHNIIQILTIFGKIVALFSHSTQYVCNSDCE